MSRAVIVRNRLHYRMAAQTLADAAGILRGGGMEVLAEELESIELVLLDLPRHHRKGDIEVGEVHSRKISVESGRR